jgi:hypothetical protein
MNTANYNTATGFEALFSNKTGSRNTANGINALLFNQVGSSNTAIGTNALYRNSASNNTAIGDSALFSNVSGTGNTATGFRALFNNTTVGALSGDDNTAIGSSALFSNMTGFTNTAVGFDALTSNIDGSGNTAIGFDALAVNTHGFANTAVGNAALANCTGNGNTALGSGAGSDHLFDFNNIDIGNIGHAGESGAIRIGTVGTQTATLIAGIFGVGFGTEPVFVNSNGQLGVGVSSARFKTEIKPMDKVSEAILALKPVTFRYKQEIDPKAMLRFGLVAEEVAKVNPDLVGRDAKGQVQTVHYEAVNAMLLNEFLKEHRTVQELKATVAQQQKQIEALTAGLQKVSAQLEASKPAPQMVNNP